MFQLSSEIDQIICRHNLKILILSIQQDFTRLLKHILDLIDINRCTFDWGSNVRLLVQIQLVSIFWFNQKSCLSVMRVLLQGGGAPGLVGSEGSEAVDLVC